MSKSNSGRQCCPVFCDVVHWFWPFVIFLSSESISTWNKLRTFLVCLQNCNTTKSPAKVNLHYYFCFWGANRTNQNSKKQIKSLNAMEKKMPTKNEIDYHLIKLCHSGGQIEFWLPPSCDFTTDELRSAWNSSNTWWFPFFISWFMLLFCFLVSYGTL